MYARQKVEVFIGAYDKGGASVLIDERLPRPCTFQGNEYLDDNLSTRSTAISAAAKIIGCEMGPDIAHVAQAMLEASLPTEQQLPQLELNRAGRLLVSLFLKRDPEFIIKKVGKSDGKHIKVVRSAQALPTENSQPEIDMTAACLDGASQISKQIHLWERLTKAGMLACATPLVSMAGLPFADHLSTPGVQRLAYETIINLNFGGITVALAGTFAAKRFNGMRTDPRTSAEIMFIPAT